MTFSSSPSASPAPLVSLGDVEAQLAVHSVRTTERFSGRVFTHWSQYMLLGGAAVSVGGAVFCYITKRYFPTGIFAVLALTELVPAFVMRKWVPLRQLDDTTEALGVGASVLVQTHEGISATLGQLSTTGESFQASIAAANQTIAQLRQDNEKLGKELEKLTGNFTAAQKRFTKLFTVAKQIKGVVGDFSSQLGEYNSSQKMMGKHLKNLDTTVAFIESQKKELTEAVGGIDQENAELAELLTNLEAFIQQLDLLTVSHVALKTDWDKLSERVGKLDEVDDKLLASTQNLQETTAKLEILKKEIQKASAQLEQFQQTVAHYPQIAIMFQTMQGSSTSQS